MRSGNYIGDEGAQAVAEALTINTTLTTLNLWGAWCAPTAVGADARTCVCTENNIGVVGAQAVAESLKTNTTLTKLSLQSTAMVVDLLR